MYCDIHNKRYVTDKLKNLQHNQELNTITYKEIMSIYNDYLLKRKILLYIFQFHSIKYSDFVYVYENTNCVSAVESTCIEINQDLRCRIYRPIIRESIERIYLIEPTEDILKILKLYQYKVRRRGMYIIL